MQLVVIQVEVLENIVFALKKCVSAFYSIIESWGGICGGCVPFFFFFFFLDLNGSNEPLVFTCSKGCKIVSNVSKQLRY